MTNTYTLELDGGYHVEVHYEHHKPELDYVHGTGTYGGVTVYFIYANLPDVNGKMIQVDVLHFLTSTGLVDIEELEQHIQDDVV